MAANQSVILLAATDLITVFLAAATAFFLTSGRLPAQVDLLELGSLPTLIYLLILLFSSLLVEASNRRHDLGLKGVGARTVLTTLLSFLLLVSFCYPIGIFSLKDRFLVLSLVIFGTYRFFCQAGYRYCVGQRFADRVLILGVGAQASSLGKLMAGSGYVLAGYVSYGDEERQVPQDLILPADEGLCTLARRLRCSKIVVTLSERRGTLPLREMMSCKLNGIEVTDAPSFYEQLSGRLLLEAITPSWFIFSEGFRVSARRRIAKRVVDVICAAIGMGGTLLLLPLAALAIRLDSPGPIFFQQKRVGEGDRLFTLYKFRTMREGAETGTGAVWASESDPRITRVGRFFRRCRFDELPQFYNVLRGDMSLVGPRPERQEFVDKLKEIIPYYSERHRVKPGVTGWAQVRYRYGASAGDAIEKLRYDLYYVKHLSLVFDLVILFDTVVVVLFQRGGR